jgi:hypothetical protein
MCGGGDRWKMSKICFKVMRRKIHLAVLHCFSLLVHSINKMNSRDYQHTLIIMVCCAISEIVFPHISLSRTCATPIARTFHDNNINNMVCLCRAPHSRFPCFFPSARPHLAYYAVKFQAVRTLLANFLGAVAIRSQAGDVIYCYLILLQALGETAPHIFSQQNQLDIFLYFSPQL